MRISFGVIGFLLTAVTLHCQVIFYIKKLPANTPETDTIFLSGNINDWSPADPEFRFQHGPAGHLQLELPAEIRLPLEYKLTRGSWARVETNRYGQFVDNRVYNGPCKGDSVLLEIMSWDDLPGSGAGNWLEISIDKLPENTPHDATLFVVGDFNGWNPGDPDFELKKQENGRWQVSIPLLHDTTFYKFTRGDWKTIEGRKNGRARANRMFIQRLDAAQTRITARIESWEDLAGKPINLYTFFLLLAAFQSLLLILAINTIQDNNRSANKVLSLLLAALAVALSSRVSTYDRDIFQWMPSLLLLPDLIYFIYAPLFLLYINKLLRTPSRATYSARWLHLIPFLVQFAVYLPLFLLPREALIAKVVDQDLKPLFAWSGGLALIFNSIYWILCRRAIDQYNTESENERAAEPNLAYLKVVMWLKMICLVIWAITIAVGALGWWWLGMDTSFITDRTTDMLWVAFALTAFFHGYYAMRQPEIFKLPSTDEVVNEEGRAEIERVASMSPSEMGLIKEKIETIMTDGRPYRMPEISLNGLADLAGITPHALSRVINEGYGMNFNDFVNSYRIDEFKRLIMLEKHKQHTLLSLAFDVGFNSKSAFNRSFKKFEHCTPREYLQKIE